MRICVLAIVVSLMGCGVGPLPAGAVCEETDGCEDGLTCLEIGQFSGGTCTVVGKVCSLSCVDDTSCASLGSNFKCFASCGAERVCGEIATP